MSEEWYVAPTGAERLGPMDEAAVRTMIRDGKVWPVSLCWRYGFSDWRRLGEVREFRGLFAHGLPTGPPTIAKPVIADVDERPGAVGPALERGKEAARRVFTAGREAVVRTVRSTDLSLKINIRRRGLRKHYAAIGEGVWTSGKDFLNGAEFQTIAEEIKTANNEIEALEKELAAVKAPQPETPE